MKFPAYPRYQESGVQWLGEVPKHWEIRPIKRLVSTPVTDGPHETPEILTEGIPFVSAEAINNGKINFDKIRGYISEENHQKYSKKYKPEKGDLFMVKSGATTGRVAMVETGLEFNIWSPLAAIRPDDRLAYSRFLYHYLHSNEFQTAVQLGWNFGTQQNIGMGVIQNLVAPKPPLPEQTAIADFLDRETGRIDTLVAKKHRLLELLEEKRTVLISRTVTRGLPAEVAREFGIEPHTRFKDSGIDWLGEVPEGWEVKKLSYLALLRSGENITSVQIAEGGQFPVYGGNGFRGYYNTFTHCGIFILIGRQGALCGNINYAEGKFWASEHAIVVTPLVSFETKWLGEVLKTMDLNQYSVSAAQPGLSVSMISGFKIPVPTLSEQAAIATYLDRETTKIDQLKQKVQKAIARLQEYRTALITAAVTGKIDVRNRAV